MQCLIFFAGVGLGAFITVQGCLMIGALGRKEHTEAIAEQNKRQDHVNFLLEERNAIDARRENIEREQLRIALKAQGKS